MILRKKFFVTGLLLMPMSLWGAAASRPDPQRDAAMQGTGRSIYWKKIRRDDLRIYLRESNEGIYLYLLPRKQWMRAADLRRRF